MHDANWRHTVQTRSCKSQVEWEAWRDFAGAYGGTRGRPRHVPNHNRSDQAGKLETKEKAWIVGTGVADAC